MKLFSDPARLPLVFMTIFAFSLSDTFDTLGTFIGTGRKTGIFSEEDERQLENGSGFSSKMDKALFADAIGTSIGAIFGTSNTTTYVESAAGIGAGGRTGLTAVVTVRTLPIINIISTIRGNRSCRSNSTSVNYRWGDDAFFIRRCEMGRIGRSHSSVLCRHLHGTLLQYLLRDCSRIYLLLLSKSHYW